MSGYSLDVDARQRGLRMSLYDGLFYAVMVGVSESYLGAFAVELGHGPTALGLLSALPLLVGALSQLAAPRLVRRLGSRKRLVVGGAFVQALAHLGLIMIASSKSSSLSALLSVKIAFWVSGSVIAPAWSAWMASLTRATDRERYFARRSAAIQGVLLVAFVSAGASLGHVAAGDRLGTFAWLFGIALLARVASATCLRVQPDPDASASLQGALQLRATLRQSRWLAVLYLTGLMFGAHLSVPFFTPYMLLDLRLDYVTFAALSAISILAKALYLPFCHLLAARFRLDRLLFVSGIAVATVPALWTMGRGVPQLLLAHVVGGIAWAGLEYASFQVLLDSSRVEHRLEFMALANSVTGVAQVAGALVGAKLLELYSLSYTDVFWLSAAFRALPILLLVGHERQLRPARLRLLALRLVGVRPSGGAQQRPMLVESFPGDKDRPDEP